MTYATSEAEIQPERAASTSLRCLRWLRSGAGVALAILLFVCGLGKAHFGDWHIPFAYMDGQGLCAINSVRDLGDISDTPPAKASFTLKNLATRTVRVLGARTNCGCVRVTGIPCDVVPGTCVEVQLYAHPRKEFLGHPFRFTAALFCDGQTPDVRIAIVGRFKNERSGIAESADAHNVQD